MAVPLSSPSTQRLVFSNLLPLLLLLLSLLITLPASLSTTLLHYPTRTGLILASDTRTSSSPYSPYLTTKKHHLITPSSLGLPPLPPSSPPSDWWCLSIMRSGHTLTSLAFLSSFRSLLSSHVSSSYYTRTPPILSLCRPTLLSLVRSACAELQGTVKPATVVVSLIDGTGERTVLEVKISKAKDEKEVREGDRPSRTHARKRRRGVTDE